jgi:uncharacterized membrane protein
MTVALHYGLLAAAFLVLYANPAAADLKICNRTSYVLYAATAAETPSEFASQGWTRLVPGACQSALSGALTAMAYYVYARSSEAHAGPARAWGGTRPICVKDVDFTSRDSVSAHECQSDNFFTLPFAAIDTHHLTSWIMTLSETADIATLDEARTAGLKRLLKDLGYKFAVIDGRADKAADVALADFRKRQHVSQNATDSDMFDALETGALKAAAPAGYSICNDTAQPLAAAIGEKIAGNWISHGWWKIAAGSCARAITTPLSADSIYLFAQKVGGPALVTGRDKFCVADIEFDVQGRTRCKDRGLSEIGFAKTQTKGMTGYSAHVGETGLVAPGYRTTSK